jgi:hypothetical protein
MRRLKAVRLGAVAALAVALTCGSMTTAATATEGGSRRGIGDEKVVKLVASVRSCTRVDRNKNGRPDPGDELVCVDNLARDGVKVGHDGRVCTVLAAAPDGSGEEQCVVTHTLPGGQITAQGLDAYPARGTYQYDIAITGGTGKYLGAHGYVHVVVDRPKAHLTFHLHTH